jgi:hypothetical protein
MDPQALFAVEDGFLHISTSEGPPRRPGAGSEENCLLGIFGGWRNLSPCGAAMLGSQRTTDARSYLREC